MMLSLVMMALSVPLTINSAGRLEEREGLKETERQVELKLCRDGATAVGIPEGSREQVDNCALWYTFLTLHNSCDCNLCEDS